MELNKTNLITGAVISAVFLSGAGFGIAAYQYLAPESPRSPLAEAGWEEGASPLPSGHGAGESASEDESAGHPPGPTFAMSRMLSQHLELTGDQEEEVREILKRRRSAVSDIWRQTRERFSRQLDSTESEISEVLTAEQAKQFRTMMETMRERHRRHDSSSFQMKPGDPPPR